MEMLGDWVKNYKKQTYIDTGVGNSETYEAMSKTEALKNSLEHETVKGDIRLIQELTDGNWNEEDFLIIPPNNTITATHDESIMSYAEK